MCFWVEKAHLQELIRSVSSRVDELRLGAPAKSKDFLIELHGRTAEAAIIFRDLPKVHGNVIQRAVGIALENHPGGYSESSKDFTFLSGLRVQVDNFFLSSKGQIFLFETKRQHGTIREDGVAGRALWATKRMIEQKVARETGRRLAHEIVVAYFSYIDASFGGKPKAKSVNIGTASAPKIISMPVYSREEMNNIIGPCFGEYLNRVDLTIAEAVAAGVPELMVSTDRRRGSEAPGAFELFEVEPDERNGRILIGDDPMPRRLKVDDILAPA
ncbi:hypothetical protein [Methylobacterium nigriterrae]|uniref:hypothetical protein n=1 Tax=Methylobacterium nigriterrae TaxID=3127512 RepID=UPI003013650D